MSYERKKQMLDHLPWDEVAANYGQWHIDHRRPCASFDLSDPHQANECFHHTNLQPLWAEDNQRKTSMVGGFIYHRVKPVQEVVPQEF